MSLMKGKRWVVLPVAGLAAVIIGIVAVEAAPSPSASGSKNYAQVFVDKLAAILHLNSSQTKDALKQAELQTVDQMLKDGTITQQQAQEEARMARVGSGLKFRSGHKGGPASPGATPGQSPAPTPAAFYSTI